MSDRLDQTTNSYLDLLGELNCLVRREYSEINNGDTFITVKNFDNLLDKIETLHRKYQDKSQDNLPLSDIQRISYQQDLIA